MNIATQTSPASALHAKHDDYSRLRLSLRQTPALPLSPALTWPMFWNQVNAALSRCGYRRTTRRAYRQILRELRRSGLTRPADISAEHVQRHLQRVAGPRPSGSWLALHICALRTIFDQLCGLTVTRGLRTPRRASRIPVILSPSETQRLILAAGSIRDQLLLGLLYGCAITGSEARSLRWRDVRNNGTLLHIPGSFRYRERILTVPEPFQQILAAGAITSPLDNPIFCGHDPATPLSHRRIEQIVRTSTRAARIQTKLVSVLTLRHSYAVHRLEDGASVRHVQEELGHCSVRTTLRYRRCIPPRLANHPLTAVRKRINQLSSERPCSRMNAINILGIHLPFETGSDTTTRFFTWFRSRLLKGFLVRPAPA
jgi:integrase/recombinase XerD